MNGRPPIRTAELEKWLTETFRAFADDITDGKAVSRDLKRTMGLISALSLRIDSHESVQSKAKALDDLCAREVKKQEHKKWLRLLRSAYKALAGAAYRSLAESSTDVSKDLDEAVLADIVEQARDVKLKRHAVHRLMLRMCRCVRRILA